MVLATEKATTVAAFARMTVEDSRTILSPEHYPSWVVFSQRQKVLFICLFVLMFITVLHVLAIVICEVVIDANMIFFLDF